MGEGSIFKWRGKWAYEYRSGGEVKRKTFDKRADAVAAKKQVISDGQRLTSSKITVADYLKSWLVRVEKSKAKNTHRNYQSISGAYLIPLLGDVRLQDLTGVHVEDMLSAIDASDQVRRYCHTVLKSALDRAMELKLILNNPCQQAEKPRFRKGGEINPYDSSEVKLILEAANGHRHEALLWLAFSAGVRQGELLGLHWENVNFDSGRIFIHRQAVEVGGHTSIEMLKTNSSVRHIELTPKSVEKLHERRAWALREGLVKSPLVFASKSGKILHKASLYRHTWTPVIGKAGVEYRNFHQARHSYATIALSRGVPVVEVSKVLGHSSPAQTLTTYAHWASEYEGRSRDEMAKIIG